MNSLQLHALETRKTDVQGALHRVCDSEQIYSTCLRDFIDDPTMNELNCAVEQEQWDEAFTAAHALKGIAGNMGFVPLMHAVGQLVVVIRGGRMKEMSEALERANSSYRDIIDGIKQYIKYSEKDGEKE